MLLLRDHLAILYKISVGILVNCNIGFECETLLLAIIFCSCDGCIGMVFYLVSLCIPFKVIYQCKPS